MGVEWPSNGVPRIHWGQDRRAENRGGGVLGQQAPSPRARGLGERCKLPQRGSGQSLDRPKVFRYFQHSGWPLLKVKVHTLDIAPLRSESPPQKRSGMARVLKGFHSFTCTHTHVHPQSERAIPAFAFPVITGTHLPAPEGWKAE